MHLWEQVPMEWKPNLAKFQDDFQQLEEKLAARAQSGIQFAPDFPNILRCLEISPSHVRVVIVGQDPYPTAGHATGLAFSVPSGTAPLPATLRNILKEVRDDIGQSQCESGDLTPWHKQGVMLLNRVLTVDVGDTGSHSNFGWQRLTSAFIEVAAAANPHLIGVLWGKSAGELVPLFKPELLIQSVHPSPLSAYRGFFGTKPFSQVDGLLNQVGSNSILW